MNGDFLTRVCLPSGTLLKFRLIVSTLVLTLVISSYARVSAQGGKTSCHIPSVKPLANTSLTCHFPEDVSHTKKDFTVYHYKDKERPDAVLNCWWLSGNVDCFVKPGYQYDRKISDRMLLAIPRVSTSQMGWYTCQLVGYGPDDISTCQLDVLTGGGSVCNMPSVIQESETSLSCYFPVDLSKTRQDFAVYHLYQGVEAAVLSCTWKENIPNCIIAQGFQFDRSVSNHLILTIPNAVKAHEGTYSCQSTSKEPFLSNTCAFTLQKVTSCSSQSVKEEQPTELRCNFSVDVSKTRQDFKVVLQGQDEDILTCTWPDGKLVCRTAPGYDFANIVTNRLVVVKVPRSSLKQNGTYACHLQGFDPSDFQSCDFLVTSDSVTSLDVGAIVGGVIAVVAVIAIITVIIVLHKRRQTSEKTVSKGEQLSLLDKKEDATQKFLIDSSKKMYQDMETSLYFVPSLYVNRNTYRTEEFAGEQIFITQPSNKDDIEHDKAMQEILQNLHLKADSEEEAMFVISQFDYNSYLTTSGDAFPGHQPPMPAKLRQKEENYGDFDLLIVHRLYGLLVVVVKTCSVESGDGQEERDDTKLVDEVKNGVNQLLDAEHMLQHLLSDQQWNLAVHKTLMLPNVSEEVLRGELAKHSLEGLVDSDGKMNLTLPMFRRKTQSSFRNVSIQDSCLCAERLKSRSTSMKLWLKSVFNGDSIISDEQYRIITSRLCGPASQSPLPVPNTIKPVTLPVTPEHAVCLTGNLFETIILHEDHLSVLKDAPSRVCLYGPPGTGKTKTLVLIGRRWLSEGHEVHVVSLWQTSLAASSVLFETLDRKFDRSHGEGGPQAPQGHVVSMAFDLKRDNIGDIVRALKDKLPLKGELFILCDEVDHDGDNTLFIYFCKKLLKKIPTIHLWFASCSKDICQESWQMQGFLHPISCPPAILKERQLSEAVDLCKISKWALDSNTWTPTEGPSVKHVYHGGEKHSEGDPQDCKACAEQVIRYLQPLFTGKAPLTSESAPTANSTSIETSSPASELRLQDNDLMMLTECDVKENMIFFELLRQSGFKTKLIKEPGIDSFLKDTRECVVIANGKDVHGIKRKVVVFLEAKLIQSNSKKPNKPADYFKRVRCLTSCTSQLIWVRISEKQIS